MKKILVPTDFSDHALNALKAAASIARKIKAEINLVHVYILPSAGFELYHYYFDKYNKEIRVNANKQLDKLAGMAFLKGISVKKHIVTNMLMWEIVSDERFKNTDLIVMGSHRTSEFSKAFIGSSIEKAVRMADSPILTIKSDFKDFAIKKMVFVSNFSEDSYSVFEKMKFLTDIYNTHIHLLKVITPKHFDSTHHSQELVKKFVKRFKLKNYSIDIFNTRKLENFIMKFSNEVNADLIAIETHGRTGLAHLIKGSLAEDVVMHETKPILSIKIPTVSVPSLGITGFRNEYSNWGNELYI